MNYANIKYLDIANGAGCRTSLFVSGCTHHCRGCFNAETWDFAYGKAFDRTVEEELLQSLAPSYNSGLSVLGGEPLEVSNQRALLPFLKKVRSAYPEKSIWLWSGYTWEEITDPQQTRCHCELTAELLRLLDVLVDGKFVLEKKNISLRFRGSSNQRILDVPASLKSGTPVLSHYMKRD
ncbi:MAG: anaerobic ribonucleoside-triphosphate reductase activating protein [Oscillospiraceae bacterium]|nr:anaerobic ribonucleoside-triphosphate reductase activating protein [Oscillospiraceae bacterium]